MIPPEGTEEGTYRISGVSRATPHLILVRYNGGHI